MCDAVGGYCCHCGEVAWTSDRCVLESEVSLQAVGRIPVRYVSVGRKPRWRPVVLIICSRGRSERWKLSRIALIGIPYISPTELMKSARFFGSEDSLGRFSVPQYEMNPPVVRGWP